jgi:hypothetical protein
MNRCAALFFAFLIASGAEAQKRARPAERYEPAVKTLLSVAPAASYRKYLRELEQTEGPVEPCYGSEPGNPKLCKGEDNRYFVPPLVPEIYPDADAWVPVSEFRGGAAKLRRWVADARSGALHCDEYEGCSFFGFARVPGAFAAESVLVQCHIPADVAVDGPPDECFIAAALSEKGNYLAAYTCGNCGGGAAGEEDFRYQLFLSSAGDLPAVRTAVQRSFESLGLETVLKNAGVLGRAKYRVSPVIQGWRDYITVRAFFEETDRPNAVELAVATTIYVNRQNTDRPDDWHLPSDQQQAAYVAQLSASVKRQLATVCPRGGWRDAETFVCRR